MALVRSEYAPELAVLSAWLCALMPWSVTVLRPPDAGLTFVILRYAYFHLQFFLNLTSPDWFLWLDDAYRFVGPGVKPAILAAEVAGAVFSLALALSIVYYFAEEWVESTAPVDPVRLMGGLLALAAVGYAASYVLLLGSKAGLTLPVGLLFIGGFAAVLLRIDRS